MISTTTTKTKASRPRTFSSFPFFFFSSFFFFFFIFSLVKVGAFKAQDFKTCETSSFCNRHRDAAPKAYSIGKLIVPSSSSSSSASSSSSQERSNRKEEDEDEASFDVLLDDMKTSVEMKLNAYANGAVRLRFDDILHPRYVPKDVLVPEETVKALQTKWVVERNMEKNAESGKTETVLKMVASGMNVRVRVEHETPLAVVVERDGVEVMAFNREETFAFETVDDVSGLAREGDNTVETFNSHTDSRPYGNTAISFDVSFPNATDMYGLPERATSLSLKSTIKRPSSQEEVDQKLHHESEPYRLYNLDVFEYESESPFGLYGSIPMLLAHGSKNVNGAGNDDGKARETISSGMYFHNPTETYVDIVKEESSLDERTSHWMAESGALDLFLFPGMDFASIHKMYGDFLGTTALPPLFSLGYHQCRWNYRDEQDVEEVDAGFDEHDIPYDVIWLDIEHTDGKRYMTWDSTKFPTPERMINDIAEKGRKMVVIIDPHVKKDDKYPIFKEAESKQYYVKKNDKTTDFDGWCWPGSSMYLDVTNPDVRSWWASKFALDSYKGSTPDLYVWNDMNEPSVFNGPEITMQKDLIHHGEVEHREVHNVFGMYYHMATAEGIEKRQNERPFVLSRAFFAGTQRIGPIWTGDNAADWEHLRVSVPMVLTLGLTGLPFSGADIGGFFGNPDSELLVRWYQLGAFYPFMRGHAHIDTKRREPWLFGDENTNLIREAIRNRYRLLPTFYALFDENSRLGTPIVRPLFYAFPDDPRVLRKDDCFMLGDALLVYPVMEAGASQIEIYLPKGVWYDVDTNEKHFGPKEFMKKVTMRDIPQFQRGGSILITKERARRSTKAQRNDPITISIAPDEKGEARGAYYNDDGISFAHASPSGRNRKKLWWSRYALATSTYDPVSSKVPFFIDETEVERVRVLGDDELNASWKQANLNPPRSPQKNTSDVAFESNGVLNINAPFSSMHGVFVIGLVK